MTEAVREGLRAFEARIEAKRAARHAAFEDEARQARFTEEARNWPYALSDRGDK